MSATIAWSDFLQTSGKWPASLTMPPRCPPMPSAQVLQAFFGAHRLPELADAARFATFAEGVESAGQPPPVLTFHRWFLRSRSGAGRWSELRGADRLCGVGHAHGARSLGGQRDFCRESLLTSTRTARRRQARPSCGASFLDKAADRNLGEVAPSIGLALAARSLRTGRPPRQN